MSGVHFLSMPTSDLQFDPATATRALRKADRVLGQLIDRAGPFTLEPEKLRSPFHALARAIIYQQLSGKAAATIFGRVEAIFPRRGFRPEIVMATPDEAFRTAGMSRAKVAALKDLAAKTLDGTVPTLARLKRMEDAEILARLVSVRGIGPWTVEMLLIFRLGRPDVLPVSDLGVRRGFMLTYEHSDMPGAARIIEHAERWRPYRSVASWYLWRAVDLERKSRETLATGNHQR